MQAGVATITPPKASCPRIGRGTDPQKEIKEWRIGIIVIKSWIIKGRLLNRRRELSMEIEIIADF